MPTLLSSIKETSEKSSGFTDDVVVSLARDVNYIRASSSMVTDALRKGCDIIQLANGDILITEVKTVTYKYNWNNEKGRFERANSGNRVKRPRKTRAA